MNAQIEKYIDDHFEEMLKDLKDFVAIPSVSLDHDNGQSSSVSCWFGGRLRI